VRWWLDRLERWQAHEPDFMTLCQVARCSSQLHDLVEEEKYCREALTRNALHRMRGAVTVAPVERYLTLSWGLGHSLNALS
jgi:hypothetical protein